MPCGKLKLKCCPVVTLKNHTIRLVKPSSAPYESGMSGYVVAALYRFQKFDNPAGLRTRVWDMCAAADVRGTLLLASEGINGTIAGTRSGIDAVLAGLRTLPGCDALEWKESHAEEMPFLRLRVRLKKEIVTIGLPEVDPTETVGTYVAPKDWNALVDDPDVVMIDTRNDYEVAIGSFRGAEDPETASFRDFPNWWQDNKDRFDGKRVAMFCTGGIRCEKASSYLLGEGVEEVFHLKGGILKYLEEVPEAQSRWDGACFVFDQRVAVEHGLRKSDFEMCFACRRPVSRTDRAHADYVPGISCPACISEFSDDERNRFRERQRQMDLAKQRGDQHLGSAPSLTHAPEPVGGVQDGHSPALHLPSKGAPKDT